MVNAIAWPAGQNRRHSHKLGGDGWYPVKNESVLTYEHYKEFNQSPDSL